MSRLVLTGAQWRDLPNEFGNWNSVFKRVRRWVKADVFYLIFKSLSASPDFEYAMIDGSIVKVHRSGQGAKGGLRGKSRGGVTTKTLALTDALGNLADFRLLPGQAHDLRGVPDLFDALSGRDIAPVIPPRKNRRQPAGYDKEMYKWRHLVENFFQKIKDYRGIATRYCKTNTSFSAFISIAATILWLK